jgi:hypothetical protein
MHYKSSLYKKINKMKYKGRGSAGKFSVFRVSYLQTALTTVFTCSPAVRVAVFINCVVLSFPPPPFRSCSHPVPHRGERVKQGTMHARNISTIIYKTFLSCYILRHFYAVIIAG